MSGMTREKLLKNHKFSMHGISRKKRTKALKAVLLTIVTQQHNLNQQNKRQQKLFQKTIGGIQIREYTWSRDEENNERQYSVMKFIEPKDSSKSPRKKILFFHGKPKRSKNKRERD